MTLRIAQITDLHARGSILGESRHAQRLCRDVWTLLPLALERVAKAGVDLLVLTGDLVDAPDYLCVWPNAEVQDDDARRVLVDYQRLKAMLDQSCLRYLVLPGNHDADYLMWRVFGRGEDEFDLGGFRIARFIDHETDNHIPRRLGEDRARFETLTGQVDGPPQIHLQHYVITPTLNEGYPHTYADAADLLNRIRVCGRVVLSLSGHYHAGTEPISDGQCTYATGPAFCQQPHPVRLFNVSTGGQVTMMQI